MKKTDCPFMPEEWGFSLVEVLISLTITAIVMASVYGLLRKGQEAAIREPEISTLQQNARGGLSMLDRDLTLAGYKTPGAVSILMDDGEGTRPDGITILYSDADVPTSRTYPCRRGLRCETVNGSLVFHVKPTSIDPTPSDPTQAYARGMILVAMESSDCNKDGKMGFYPFTVNEPARLDTIGNLPALSIRHEPIPTERFLELPASFNNEVHPDCALVGQFHIVQYRIHPLPPTPHPNLERRDLSQGATWVQVAENIENLQLQYATGSSEDFEDAPQLPRSTDPLTWITGVKVTIAGRSDSADLAGSSSSAYEEEGSHLRKTFSTTVSLRNLVAQIQQQTRNRTYN